MATMHAISNRRQAADDAVTVRRQAAHNGAIKRHGDAVLALEEQRKATATKRSSEAEGLREAAAAQLGDVDSEKRGWQAGAQTEARHRAALEAEVHSMRGDAELLHQQLASARLDIDGLERTLREASSHRCKGSCDLPSLDLERWS
jgi:chromosome segregation ATPase